jgi:predicted GNAT family N-acyltransferase
MAHQLKTYSCRNSIRLICITAFILPIRPTILEVYGTTLTERIESELAAFGFNEFTSISGGFRAVRAIPGENDSAIKIGAEYEVGACTPRDLARAELETCFAIIEQGEAVDVDSMKRDLPRSSVLAVARKDTKIVGVGAIKPVRKGYAAKASRNSRVKFPPETPELGYVAVDEIPRDDGLSYRIVEALLSRNTGRLFATTDAIGMKKPLAKYGFVKKGDEWKGERGMLSYWERK